MNNTFLGLPSAQIKWSQADEPEDIQTGDVYFSADDGLAETRTVFLDGCHLPRRWVAGRDHVIGELGFGTGLNFMATMKRWQETAKPGQILHYIAVEGYPLCLNDMARAHAPFDALAKEAAAFRAMWPARVKGFHHHVFSGNIRLTLLFGPAEEMLAQVHGRVDSWFLDGFTPAKNPQMWTDEVFSHIAKLSAPNAHLASYSVAGIVRRGLQKVGFDVQKHPGYGRKRERLEAILKDTAVHNPVPAKAAIAKSVIILGGGIAGACLAHELTLAGISFVLLDKGGLAKGASGNACGLLSPRLDLDDTPLARFYRCAFAYALRFYAKNCADCFVQTGIKRIAETLKQKQKFLGLYNASALPKEWMALHADGAALEISCAATLRPVQAISQLVDKTNVIIAHVEQLIFEKTKWIALDNTGREIASADAVILANGAYTIPGLDLPDLRTLRGQVSIAEQIKNPPQTPLIGKSYALSLGQNQLLFGATHDRVDQVGDCEVRAQDHQRNLQNLQQLDQELAADIDPKTLTGRTSYRAASLDMHPLAGPVADAKACANWSKNYWGKLHDYTDAPVLPGLYMLNGLGSRGLCLAPLLAANIVAQITGAPLPLEFEAATALHPARFAARTARRG